MKKLFIGLLLAGLLTGCSRQWYDQRNIKRMDSYMVQYQQPAAELANQLWPCFTGRAKADTTYLPGRIDTVILPGKMLPGISGKPDTVILPGRIITITNRTPIIHDTIPDTRAQAVLNLRITALQATTSQQAGTISQLQSDKSSRGRTILILALILGVEVLIAVAWFILRIYSGPASKIKL